MKPWESIYQTGPDASPVIVGGGLTVTDFWARYGAGVDVIEWSDADGRELDEEPDGGQIVEAFRLHAGYCFASLAGR